MSDSQKVSHSEIGAFAFEHNLGADREFDFYLIVQGQIFIHLYRKLFLLFMLIRFLTLTSEGVLIFTLVNRK